MLKKIWTEMDINKNRTIPRECVLEAYKKLYKSDEKANMEFKYLMSGSDESNNSMIDYSQLLVNIPNLKQSHTIAKLKELFDEYSSVYLNVRLG